ncbi:MAG: DUF4974 domain-containing protein [Cytophagales bacterium]|nr:DUF4974 domain-containing protein [Cytophagales bacterium]
MNLKLLKKYFENRCSPEEAEEIMRWIERSGSSADMETDFMLAWENIKVKPGDYKKWSDKLDKVHQQIEMEELYGSLNLNKNKPDRSFISKDRPAKSLGRLGRNRAKSKFRYLALPGFVIIIALMLAVYYQPSGDPPLQTITQIEKSTEPGQKLSFHLEDGSKVILNAGSNLIYPSGFSDTERKVILKGEAFFEIRKDANRPFRVVTDSIVTTALGTSFNVNAFPSVGKIEIALVSGKVTVQQLSQSDSANYMLLEPGEMATIVRGDHSFIKKTYDYREVASWKDGILFYRDADFHEIVKSLESWYGVRIKFNRPPQKTWQFTGKFEDETLEDILIALQFGHDFDYEIRGKEIKLNF